MAKRQREELAFGSDSFLDVVAIIVGILIILIVVAGVRVSQMPAIVAEATAEPVEQPVDTEPLAPNWNEEPPSLAMAEIITKIEEPTFTKTALIEPSEPVQIPALPEVLTPTELIDRANFLATQAVQIEKENKALEQLLIQQFTASTEAEIERKKIRRDLSEMASRLQVQRDAISDSDQTKQKLSGQIATLRRQINNTEIQETPLREFKHVLTPVGRKVTGKEVHFRLMSNQVAHVPVKELTDALKSEIGRRKQQIAARQVYRGSIGPRDGFSLDFVIQRQGMSIFDEARLGTGTVRMELTGAQIRSSDQVNEESYAQAMQPNSHFRRALYKSGSNATVTFWVYPDSFEVHQELKKFLHDSSIWVATRPLPTGIPIAFSPKGSSSVAQ